MVRRLNGRLPWLVACAAVLTLALVSPALAQSTGMVRGVVKDAAGKPVEGAKISIDADSNNRHFDTKSDKKGEFLQIGLAPGAYKVTAEKDGLSATKTSQVQGLVTVLGGGTIDPGPAGGGTGVLNTAGGVTYAPVGSFGRDTPAVGDDQSSVLTTTEPPELEVGIARLRKEAPGNGW